MLMQLFKHTTQFMTSHGCCIVSWLLWLSPSNYGTPGKDLSYYTPKADATKKWLQGDLSYHVAQEADAVET